MFELIGKLGGRSFVVALIGLVAVILTATTGMTIKPELQNTVIEMIGAIVSAHSIGRGVADGLSKGVTASTPGTPEAETV